MKVNYIQYKVKKKKKTWIDWAWIDGAPFMFFSKSLWAHELIEFHFDGCDQHQEVIVWKVKAIEFFQSNPKQGFLIKVSFYFYFFIKWLYYCKCLF